MKQPEYITVQDLYAYAKEHKLLDARIRICDGMAVSYYPNPSSVGKGRYEIVIDVSALEPIDYDELDTWAVPQYDVDLEIDAACRHIAKARAEYIRRSQARRNAKDSQIIKAKITEQTPADELPWEIYGYGPYKRRR